MVIKRLPVKTGDGIGFRDLQAQLHEIGRIRLGVFNPDKGGRGAPEKLDRFRLTSPQRALIEAVAELYGGEPREFTPQKSKVSQWEVITETNELPVYIIPQHIDPWLESWGAGGCVRRCDGETARVREKQQEVIRPCPCAAGEVDERDVCKPTARVQLELAEVPAIGTWRLETHGDTFAREVTALADYVNRFPFAVPAMLYLEARRAQPIVNGKRMTSTVYVPHLLISVATPQQFAVGGDTLSRAIEAATGQQAIEAGSATTEVPALTTGAAPAAVKPDERFTTTAGPVPPAKVVGGIVQDAAMRAAILRDIEASATVEALDALKAKLKDRGITGADTGIVGAERSKRAALVAAHEIEAKRQAVLDGRDEYQVGDTVEVGGMTFTKVREPASIEDVFGTPPDALLPDEMWPPVLDAEEVPLTPQHQAAEREASDFIANMDLDSELNRVYTEAGKREQSTSATLALIRKACGITKMDDLGPQHAAALHSLANGIAAGSVGA